MWNKSWCYLMLQQESTFGQIETCGDMRINNNACACFNSRWRHYNVSYAESKVLEVQFLVGV